MKHLDYLLLELNRPDIILLPVLMTLDLTKRVISITELIF